VSEHIHAESDVGGFRKLLKTHLFDFDLTDRYGFIYLSIVL